MRTFLITAGAALAALGVSAPAQAQHYAPYSGYGYQQGYGHGYGYQNDWRSARYLQHRVNELQRQINMLDRRNVLSNREASRLRNQSRNIERRLRVMARNGLHPNERYSIERQIAGLERRVWAEANDRNRRYDRRHGYRDEPRWGAYRERDRRYYRHED